MNFASGSSSKCLWINYLAEMKARAFYDIAQCSLIKVDRQLRASIMEAVRTSETSVYFKDDKPREVATSG
jgi:hypothetical protein